MLFDGKSYVECTVDAASMEIVWDWVCRGGANPVTIAASFLTPAVLSENEVFLI
jgi:hypothetical protein